MHYDLLNSTTFDCIVCTLSQVFCLFCSFHCLRWIPELRKWLDGGTSPGCGALIDGPEHRGAVGDEERSDSGPLDTPWFTVCQILITPRLWEEKRQKGACERSQKRNEWMLGRGEEGKNREKRCMRCHISLAAWDCGQRRISSPWQIEVRVRLLLTSRCHADKFPLYGISRLSCLTFCRSFSTVCLFSVWISLSCVFLNNICGRWNKAWEF